MVGGGEGGLYAGVGVNSCGWLRTPTPAHTAVRRRYRGVYAGVGVYPPRARLRALRYAEAGKAGLCAETYRAWLPPRLTPWAGKSCRRRAAKGSRA